MDATIQQNLNIKETKLLKITPYIFCFFIFSKEALIQELEEKEKNKHQ